MILVRSVAIEIETYCEVKSKKDIRNSNEFSSGKAWKIYEKKSRGWKFLFR